MISVWFQSYSFYCWWFKSDFSLKLSIVDDFSPKKLLHAVKDEIYQLGMHELTGMSQMAEQVVRYDLDDLDVAWLRQLNEQREECGMSGNCLFR